ncbi:hypothetical protein VSS37_17740 [Candidatus Thiothrix sp. Deng01]|uniref:Uncharacterized protein n=1 Tax=Candidatus Thiothrix phosphatis TaxID=3112415 RepID=A0ABU6D188_9GAMM|nr:hypothetical protein [Candidatus Thiothrix sp. Deng01]MEB4592826.1 hypothetical protein [Candidatus Thiothrix sp. Deng01]
MKKILYWTIGIHLLFFGGFLSSLIAGLSYKEFDQIKAGLENIRHWIDQIDAILRLFSPWI